MLNISETPAPTMGTYIPMLPPLAPISTNTKTKSTKRPKKEVSTELSESVLKPELSLNDPNLK